MSLSISDHEKNDRLIYEANQALMALNPQALATCLDNLNNPALFVHDSEGFPDIYQQFLFALRNRLPENQKISTFAAEHAIVLVDEFSRIAGLSEHTKVCLALSQATYLDRDSYFEFFGPGKTLEINQDVFLSDFNQHLNLDAVSGAFEKDRKIARASIDQDLVVPYSYNESMHGDVFRHAIDTLNVVGQTEAIQSYAWNVSAQTRFELLKESTDENLSGWIAESLFDSPYITDVLSLGYRPGEGDLAHHLRTTYNNKLPEAFSILLEHFGKNINLNKLRDLLRHMVYPMFESVKSNAVADPVQQQMQIVYEEKVYRALIEFLDLGEVVNPYSLQELGAAMPMIFYRNLDVENFRRALIFLHPKECGVPTVPIKDDHTDAVDGEYEAQQKVRNLINKISQISEVHDGIQKDVLAGDSSPEQLALKHKMLVMMGSIYRSVAQSLRPDEDGLQP